jgi:hypothetical protein
MTAEEESSIRNAISLLRRSLCCDYNNETYIKVSEGYLDYVFRQLRAGQKVQPHKEAGFALAGF